MTAERPLYVGLTGGIGSGKTTVADVWRELGITVVDADQIARSILEPGGGAVDAIEKEFGKSVIEGSGASRCVSRPALAEIVFNDSSAKRRLEAISHPLVEQQAWHELQQLGAEDVGVYDVPLLVEGDMAPLFDLVVVVVAPEAARIDRLEKRGVNRIQARLRIESQAKDEERLQVADIVIRNDGGFDQLIERARSVGKQLLQAR